jgi:hypothetical protein
MPAQRSSRRLRGVAADGSLNFKRTRKLTRLILAVFDVQQVTPSIPKRVTSCRIVSLDITPTLIIRTFIKKT